MKKIILTSVMLMAVNSSVYAVLAVDSNLSIDAGSTFGMEASPGFWVDIPVSDFIGINLAGSSRTAAVSVVVEPVPGSCTDLYRLKQVTTVGGGQGQSFNSTMVTTFTGNITTEAGLVSGGKNVIKIYPGTVLDFTTDSSVGETTCVVNGSVAGAAGSLTVGDKLICSNKPDGSDVDRFSIKSGI